METEWLLLCFAMRSVVSEAIKGWYSHGSNVYEEREPFVNQLFLQRVL